MFISSARWSSGERQRQHYSHPRRGHDCNKADTIWWDSGQDIPNKGCWEGCVERRRHYNSKQNTRYFT